MTFWSGDALHDGLERQNIVIPFHERHIDGAAYTLHLGDEVYITPHSGTSDPLTTTKQKLSANQAVAIPPGQFAYLLTSEEINMPVHLLGFISMRAKIKFKGLINVSGFHIDPGYSGKLIFAVYNAGPSPVHIQEGGDLFLLWIADLHNSTDKYSRNKPGHREISTDLIQEIPGEILSFQQITGQIRDLEQKMASHIPSIEFLQFIVRSVVVGVIVAIVIAILASVNPFINRVYNYLFG